jgi:hypothetical protein
MSARLRILIIGGYGTFGARLVTLLESDARLELLVAGRSFERAAAFCGARTSVKAELRPLAFDRDGDVAAQLEQAGPALVADASGPFQGYGAQRYRVAEACIVQRRDYLDLADASDFVGDIGLLDARASAAGVFVLSGASTCPALSAAAVRGLSAGVAQIEEIQAGISPSPFARVGRNVVGAIASYAGRKVALTRGGRKTTGRAFGEHKRVTIAPPGAVPLPSTLFSLVDVPDLLVLRELWPEVGSVWFGAGLRPAFLHRATVALAWIVKLRIFPSLSFATIPLHAVATRLRWGENRGGMFVAISGRDGSGTRVARSWHLIADGDDGPFIPAMAASAIIRKMLAGRRPAAGARPAARELELEDFEEFFSQRAIHTGVRCDLLPEKRPVHARVLGQIAWENLPAPLRAMHDIEGTVVAEGRASVERGTSLFARMIGFFVGFPRAADDTKVRVKFEAREGRERWTRTFGTGSFSSTQFEGSGRSARLLCEHFGPLGVAMALVPKGGKLVLGLRRWSVFGIPLPIALGPHSDTFEFVADGRFHFDVKLSHPLAGLIVHYRGWLERVATPAAAERVALLSAAR